MERVGRTRTSGKGGGKKFKATGPKAQRRSPLVPGYSQAGMGRVGLEKGQQHNTYPGIITTDMNASKTEAVPTLNIAFSVTN